MDKNKCPDLVTFTRKFSRWQNQKAPSLEDGLAILTQALQAEFAALVFYSSHQDHFEILETSPSRPDDLDALRKTLAEIARAQAPLSTQLVKKETPDGPYPYCISLLHPTGDSDDYGQLCLWNTSKFSMDVAETVFLEMAASILIGKITLPDSKPDKETILQEALDTIDDGFIIFDENEKIVTFNKQQRELFPSIKDVLKVGGHYIDILKKQQELGILDAARIGGEKWIKERRRQLRIQGYTAEQRFIDGRTIRLKNHQTPSGNTVSVRSDITELVEARQNALDNEKLFRALLTGAPIPLTIDIDGEFVYGNSHAHEIVELKDGELIGRRNTEFFAHTNSPEKVLELYQESKEIGNFELEITTALGRSKTVSIYTTPIVYRGHDAHFTSYLDITESVRNREALKRSEKQYQDLLELTPDALLVQVDGSLVYVNNSAVAMFRADNKNAMIGIAGSDLVPDEDIERLLAIRKNAASGHLSTAFDTRHIRMDGSLFHSELYAVDVVWNGKPGTMNIIRDNTRQQNYEASILQKEREMTLAQEIGHFGHWRINIEGDHVFWSEELYRIHGMDPEKDLIDMDRAQKFVVKSDREKLIDLVTKTITTQRPHASEVQLKLDNGEHRSMTVVMRAEMGDNGRVKSVFGVSQDVTEQRILEEKLRQSQKMEAVGQLTGGVAHDFNNLLAVIQGNAELLLEQEDQLDKATESQLNAIIRASERGADLTRSMLAYSRKQSLRPIVIKLDEQVESMIKILRRTLGENITIQFNSDPDLWSTAADPAQVEAALLNLSLNARDAMPDGGVLTIETRNITLDKPAPSFEDDFIPGEYVQLSVNDTGFGIDTDDLGHVFEPFFTTKEPGKGTGLGLSMVYGFTKQSNGQITINSEANKGTVIKIYLPRSKVQ